MCLKQMETLTFHFCFHVWICVHILFVNFQFFSRKQGNGFNLTSIGRFAVDREFEYIESVSSRPLVELFGPSGELVGPPRGVFEPTGELFGAPGGGPEI